jgi:hypothetical protein
MTHFNTNIYTDYDYCFCKIGNYYDRSVNKCKKVCPLENMEGNDINECVCISGYDGPIEGYGCVKSCPTGTVFYDTGLPSNTTGCYTLPES